MFKILISLLFIFTTLTIAKDDTYVFEAKGAFAKDLKALVEKYSKDGKVQVKVYKKDSSIVDAIFDRGTSSIDGQKIYVKNCASCHGKQGEVGAGAGSRILRNMTKDEIISSISKYKTDEHYGGSMKMLMHDVVIGLNDKKVTAIYNYLHNKVKNVKSSKKTETITQEKSSYLQ